MSKVIIIIPSGDPQMLTLKPFKSYFTNQFKSSKNKILLETWEEENIFKKQTCKF